MNAIDYTHMLIEVRELLLMKIWATNTIWRVGRGKPIAALAKEIGISQSLLSRLKYNSYRKGIYPGYNLTVYHRLDRYLNGLQGHGEMLDLHRHHKFLEGIRNVNADAFVIKLKSAVDEISPEYRGPVLYALTGRMPRNYRSLISKVEMILENLAGKMSKIFDEEYQEVVEALAHFRDRLKDPTGILLDARYAERDLQIALLSTSTEAPLAVAFMDMNDLTLFNNRHGHDAGDDAIRMFFETIANGITDVGEAHRVGGDEVVVILPKTSLPNGVHVLRTILRELCGRTVCEERLSAVAGIVAATDPAETAKAVRKRADVVQYRAKEFSKSRAPTRFSALAIEGQDEIEEFGT